MISLTLPSGEVGWLALYTPEMGGGMTLRLRSEIWTDRGATGRESRRPIDPTLSVEMDWQAELALSEVTAMRDALKAYQNEPIAMPCWPLAVAGADYVYGTTPQGGYMIAWNESGSYSFSAGAVSSPSSWDWIAPAVYGFFSDLPKTTASQGDFVRYSFKFIEDSPASWALGPFNTPASISGPSIGSFTPPGFPFELDWAQSVESGAAQVSVAREELGTNRRRLQTFYPNIAERIVKGQITASDPWPLVCWWHSQDGGAQSQWVTTGLSAGLLSLDAAAGASTINLTQMSGVAVDAVLAFDSNGTRFFRKVASVAGAVVTLTATLPVLCYTNLTTVSVAILARHISEDLSISWAGPGNFSARLDWQELSQEYGVAAGEVLGTTLGRKAARPYLLEISSEQPVAEVLWRITDWSTGVTLADARVFTPATMDVGERMQTIDPSDQQLQITLPWVEGSPLSHFLPGQSYRRIFAKLYHVPIASNGTVGSPVQDWYGEIIDLEYEGPKMTIQISGPSRVFDRQVPGDQYGKTCNAHLFDSRCGVDKTAWTVAASVVSVTGNTLVFGSASRPGGAMTPLQGDNAFQLGSVKWTVDGVTSVIGIYGSSYSGGNYTLTLREPVTIPGGTALTILPACDQQWKGGCLRYSGKFRGFPFIPVRAPQFLLPTSTTSHGKK